MFSCVVFLCLFTQRYVLIVVFLLYGTTVRVTTKQYIWTVENTISMLSTIIKGTSELSSQWDEMWHMQILPLWFGGWRLRNGIFFVTANPQTTCMTKIYNKFLFESLTRFEITKKGRIMNKKLRKVLQIISFFLCHQSCSLYYLFFLCF